MTTHLKRRLDRCRIHLAVIVWPGGTRGYERDLEDGIERLRGALWKARCSADEEARRDIDQALTQWP